MWSKQRMKLHLKWQPIFYLNKLFFLRMMQQNNKLSRKLRLNTVETCLQANSVTWFWCDDQKFMLDSGKCVSIFDVIKLYLFHCICSMYVIQAIVIIDARRTGSLIELAEHLKLCFSFVFLSQSFQSGLDHFCPKKVMEWI